MTEEVCKVECILKVLHLIACGNRQMYMLGHHNQKGVWANEGAVITTMLHSRNKA